MMAHPRHKSFAVGPIHEARFAKLLDEGYFKSYPMNLVKRDISKLLTSLGFTDVPDANDSVDFLFMDDSKDKFNDMDVFSVAIDTGKLTAEVKGKVKERLVRDGWYISNETNLQDAIAISCEPTYPIESDRIVKFSKEIILDHRVFYHVTFHKYAKRILACGLVPSMGARREFAHPERVYLFGEQELAQRFLELPLDDNMKGMLRNKDRITGELASQKFQNDHDLDKVMFRVDLLECLTDGKLIHLYHDNRWDDESPVYFTCNTIPNKYIEMI